MRSKESSGGLEGREVGRKGIWKDGKLGGRKFGRMGSWEEENLEGWEVGRKGIWKDGKGRMGREGWEGKDRRKRVGRFAGKREGGSEPLLLNYPFDKAPEQVYR